MLSEINVRYKGGEGKGLWCAGARPPFITHSLHTRQVTSNRGRGGVWQQIVSYGPRAPTQCLEASNCYSTSSQRRILLFGMSDAQAIHD